MFELDLPRDRVLVFPFWAWDCIFYGRFLSLMRRRSKDWGRRLLKAVADAEDLYSQRRRAEVRWAQHARLGRIGLGDLVSRYRLPRHAAHGQARR